MYKSLSRWSDKNLALGLIGAFELGRVERIRLYYEEIRVRTNGEFSPRAFVWLHQPWFEM
jgi:hypothetical protein